MIPFDTDKRETWVNIITQANTGRWINLGKDVLCQVKITNADFNKTDYLKKINTNAFCFAVAKRTHDYQKASSISVTTGFFSTKTYSARSSAHDGRWEICLADMNILTVDIEIEAQKPSINDGDDAFLANDGEISESVCTII